MWREIYGDTPMKEQLDFQMHLLGNTHTHMPFNCIPFDQIESVIFHSWMWLSCSHQINQMRHDIIVRMDRKARSPGAGREFHGFYNACSAVFGLLPITGKTIQRFFQSSLHKIQYVWIIVFVGGFNSNQQNTNNNNDNNIHRTKSDLLCNTFNDFGYCI